jgi:hypothetical protein
MVKFLEFSNSVVSLDKIDFILLSEEEGLFLIIFVFGTNYHKTKYENKEVRDLEFEKVKESLRKLELI